MHKHVIDTTSRSEYTFINVKFGNRSAECGLIFTHAYFSPVTPLEGSLYWFKAIGTEIGFAPIYGPTAEGDTINSILYNEETYAFTVAFAKSGPKILQIWYW